MTRFRVSGLALAFKRISMDIERWAFSPSINEQRLANLENPPSFEKIVKSVRDDIKVLCFHPDPCGDYGGFERVVFCIQVRQDLFDLFFNSKNGYRARYYCSQFEGMRANRLFIDTLLPILRNSPHTKNCALTVDVEESLASDSSKVWLAECGKEVRHDCNGCKGEWEASKTPDSPEIMNNRWETGAGAIAQWGSSAPYHTKLRIIGAFIDNRCNEFIPEKKRHRARDIHGFGWS